jgi:hypothetical protein
LAAKGFELEVGLDGLASSTNFLWQQPGLRCENCPNGRCAQLLSHANKDRISGAIMIGFGLFILISSVEWEQNYP